MAMVARPIQHLFVVPAVRPHHRRHGRCHELGGGCMATMGSIDLREAMISMGHPQAPGEERLIGAQPDLRRMLQTWGIR